jgi:hypothetical protein
MIAQPTTPRKTRNPTDAKSNTRGKAVPLKSDKKATAVQRDLFRLRYFRFKSSDLERTIDFYKNFEMFVQYDEVQEKVNPPADTAKPTYVNLKKESKEVKETLAPEDLDQLGKTARVVSMTYGDSAGEIATNRVHLVFEEVETEKEEEDRPQTQAEIIAKAVEQTQSDRSSHVYEYLVIYVHFLNRLFTRISGKKYECILPPTDFAGVRMALLVDPNGLHVRLVEQAPEHLVEVGKQQQVEHTDIVVCPTRVLFNGNCFRRSKCNDVRTVVSSQTAKSERQGFGRGGSYNWEAHH